MAVLGFEPKTLRLKDGRSNQLSYTAFNTFYVAGTGFEPMSLGHEPNVLTKLDHPTIFLSLAGIEPTTDHYERLILPLNYRPLYIKSTHYRTRTNTLIKDIDFKSIASTNFAKCAYNIIYLRRDLNSHLFTDYNLNVARLPISPLRLLYTLYLKLIYYKSYSFLVLFKLKLY